MFSIAKLFSMFAATVMLYQHPSMIDSLEEAIVEDTEEVTRAFVPIGQTGISSLTIESCANNSSCRQFAIKNGRQVSLDGCAYTDACIGEVDADPGAINKSCWYMIPRGADEDDYTNLLCNRDGCITEILFECVSDMETGEDRMDAERWQSLLDEVE